MNENNPIVYSVIEKLHKQQEKGLKKYGAYVKTSSYDLKEWLQHAQEEAIDFVTYLETAIQLLQEQEQAFQARYDHHISQKYEAMAGFYDGWSSSEDARNHHALSASLVYQDALTAGIRLKAEGE
ncbi:hypothetical protein LG951_05180 [Bacillus pumilus]|uniref:hypothetical protein n=1 Tax=Bacillus pumilus TaxID=1408 RepID=UPI001D009944|nr:hypothetical protein [Bacillus pumilus]UDF17584.1 hypothetical protein LG951_05180 [Bacillus pumilus]